MRIDSLSSAPNSNAQFCAEWLLRRQWWLTHNKGMCSRRRSAGVGAAIIRLCLDIHHEIWKWLCMVMISQLEMATIWIGFFLTVLDRCVTNSDAVFTWEVDPQHAELAVTTGPTSRMHHWTMEQWSFIGKFTTASHQDCFTWHQTRCGCLLLQRAESCSREGSAC